MERLRLYCKQTGISPTRLGYHAGLSPSTMSRICRYGRISAKSAIALELATNRKLRAVELLGLVQ